MDDNNTAPDIKGGGAEVIGVDGNDEDCGVDAGSLLAAAVWLQRRRKQQST